MKLHPQSSRPRPGFLPVVIGGDIGAYALARQLHEATGQRVTLLAPAPIEAITRSIYIDVEHVDITDTSILEALRRLGSGRPERSAVVMANTDGVAEILTRHRDELEPVFAVPFPDLEVMETLCDKTAFARACAVQGVRTPRQVVVHGTDLSQGDPRLDLPLPLVAKPAVGADWDAVKFPGKRKIYFIDTHEELAALWRSLRRAGYRSDFVVQERIPGDDSAMRSVTVYVASNGELTLVSSARVLLEDHSPTMIGNPVAMITEPYPELWDAAARVLMAAGYRGFANLDIKIDPRDGGAVFFEVNPRIGRNSFYVSAAGVNPMEVMLADLVDGTPGPRREATNEVLYSLIPRHLLLHQLADRELRRRVLRLSPRAVDPLLDPAETSARRRLVITAQKLNHDLKFHRYRPQRTPAPMTTKNTDERSEVLRPVSAKEMRIAIGCTPAPVEQTEVWQSFEKTQGRELFGRYVYEYEGKPVAALALYRYEIAGRPFVWAKHGPVWLKEQSPDREAHLRRLLVQEVRRRDKRVVFIRMHARYRARDLYELISTISYDRTYVIDLTPRDPDKIAAIMPKDGRRAVKRAARVAAEAGCVIAEETGLSRAAFDEVYTVMEATAARDGFRAHPAAVYWNMLQALGPDHARLFVLRRDGVPHAWDLVTVVGRHATAYYGASSNESRTFRGAEALDWHVACALAAEGCVGLDLMGADSSRVPELYSVGQYKRRYARHVTEVDGAWDVPVQRLVYSCLVRARRLRTSFREARAARR